MLFRSKEFLAIVLDYDEQTQLATLEQRNYFEKGEIVELFGHKLKNTDFKIETIYDENMQELDVARHPLQIIKTYIPFKLKTNDMMRKVLKKE